jgi:hypothetical protein
LNSRAGNYRWHSLDDARWQCGLDLPNAHRAQADTLLARACCTMWQRSTKRKRPIKSIGRLIYTLSSSAVLTNTL